MTRWKGDIIKAFILIIVLVSISMPVSAEISSTTIYANGHSYVQVSLSEGQTFVFRLIDTDNPIDIYMVDNENYFNFKDGDSFDYYVDSSLSNAMSGSFDFDAPEDGIYYLILSNRDNSEDTHIEYESYSRSNGTPGFTLPIIISALFIGVGIMTITRRFRKN